METIIKAKQSKAVVILVHGMQEYSDRYHDFCQYLVHQGYSSIRYDLLGHGQNLPVKKRGYFGHKAWHKLLDQLHHYTQLAHSQFKGQKVILFGHSMGTIIIRSYLQRYTDFDGMILSGVPYYNSLWPFGKLLSKGLVMFNGAKATSPLLTKLTTGGFNKKIKHPKTKFDWLSHNPADVKAYIKDQACGFPFTNQGYNDLYEGMREVGHLKHFHTNRPVPVLFLNGHDDPCAGNNRQVWSSIQALKKAGYNDLSYRRYPNMRHEILFEKDSMKVQRDIVDWLDNHFAI